MLSHILTPAIPIQLEIPDTLPPITVDQQQLETALFNVIDNAREAMPNSGRIKISAFTQTVRADTPPGLGDDVPPGPYVALRVQDTSTGMTNTVTNQIFQPFFTTKPVGKGSGLGLSVVFGFARQSNGAVQVTSAPGGGTTVALLFPIGEQRPGPQPAIQAWSTDCVT